jgi:hypothetical protein
MSRWLQNVGTFLEKLDDQGQQQMEKFKSKTTTDDEDDLDRLLVFETMNESDEFVLDKNDNDDQLETDVVISVEDCETGKDHDGFAVAKALEPSLTIQQFNINETSIQKESGSDSRNESGSFDTPPKHPAQKTNPSTVYSTPRQTIDTPAAAENETETNNNASATLDGSLQESLLTKNASEVLLQDDDQQQTTTTTTDATELAHPTNPTDKALFLQLTNQLRDAQKESRALKRHIVALNQKVRASDAEVDAQHEELERAAQRMEHDRARHKQERAQQAQQHAQELFVLKQQQQVATKQANERADQQLQELRMQLRTMDEKRMQEGGNWTKELEEALHREQETVERLACLEDEKATLLAQIHTLQSQQETLGLRLESLSETAETAMERERDTDLRLDETLSAHARVMAQRQAREKELERTVAELGEELVKVQAGNNPTQQHASAVPHDTNNNSILVDSLRAELETMQTQLASEQDRNRALHEELRHVSREHAQEHAVVQVRRQQHDEHVSDLTRQVTHLQLELAQQSKRATTVATSTNKKDDNERIQSLSEEVVRLQDRLSSSSAEVSAMKRRLQVAQDRTDRAEAALERLSSTTFTNFTSSDDVEASCSTRRRGKGSSRAPTSIRQALHIAPTSEAASIGKSLDAIDSFAMSGGTFLRRHPVARLLFLCYLLALHAWTFLLLFAHASHAMEVTTPHHGPSALLAVSVAAASTTNVTNHT